MKIAVIADDLTGLTDVASFLVKNGFNIKFSLDNSLFLDSDVFFFNTNTRNKSINNCKKWIEFKSLCNRFDPKYIYLKIDSTLRGNIEKEIDCMFNVFNPGKLIFVPAHPLLNRIFDGKNYYVDGKLLIDTFYIKDPLSPANPDIFNILKKKFKERIYIPKIRSIEDLKRLYPLITKYKFIVSSSSIAMLFKNNVIHNTKYEILSLDKTLIINGSLNDVTRLQIDYVKSSIAVCNKINELNKYLLEYDKVLIDITITNNKENFNSTIVRVANVIKDIKLNLIISGGETAIRILNFINISKLQIVNALFPGISVCRDNMERIIILKPGGFGEKEFYKQCFQILNL